MVSKTTQVYSGSLNPQGTRTNSFFEGDYVFIQAPSLANQGIDLEIDCFLQVVINEQDQKLIPLNPINILDTNAVTFIPQQFARGNTKELYLFILSDQSYIVTINVVSNFDTSFEDCCDEILQKLEELRQNQNSQNSQNGNNIVRTVIEIIRLGGGDFTAILPLLNSVIGNLDNLPGVELPALPANADTLPEISSFF